MDSKSQHGYSLIELVVAVALARYLSCDRSAKLE